MPDTAPTPTLLLDDDKAVALIARLLADAVVADLKQNKPTRTSADTNSGEASGFADDMDEVEKQIDEENLRNLGMSS